MSCRHDSWLNFEAWALWDRVGGVIHRTVLASTLKPKSEVYIV